MIFHKGTAFLLWIYFLLPRQLGLLEVHAPGMDGMNPAFFMTVFPSQDGDRNPGVHEDRVNEPVEVNLERHFDLKKYD